MYTLPLTRSSGRPVSQGRDNRLTRNPIQFQGGASSLMRRACGEETPAATAATPPLMHCARPQGRRPYSAVGELFPTPTPSPSTSLLATYGGLDRKEDRHSKLLVEEREAHRVEMDKVWQRLCKAQESVEREREVRVKTQKLLSREKRKNAELAELSARSLIIQDELQQRADLLAQFAHGCAHGPQPCPSVVPIRPATKGKPRSRQGRVGRTAPSPNTSVESLEPSRPLTAIVRDSELLRALQSAEHRLAMLERRARAAGLSLGDGDDFPSANGSPALFATTLTIIPDGEE